MCYLLYDVLEGFEIFSVVSFVSIVVINYDLDMCIDMVQLFLFMLGIYDKDDMLRIFLVMFNSKDSCVVMRQLGCLLLFIDFFYGKDIIDKNFCWEVCVCVGFVLYNIVFLNVEDRCGRCEV